MNEIFLNQDFWSKLASVPKSDHPPTREDAEQVLGGFFDAMKEAGFNDGQTLGFVLGVMDVEGMGKEADMAENIGDWWGRPGLWQGIKGYFHGGNKPGVIHSMQLGAAKAHAANATGFEGWVRDNIYNGDARATGAMGLDWDKKNYSKALGDIATHLPGANIIKQIAPYAVPALATFATTKLLGGGTGTALGLGAIAGGIGGGTEWGRNLQTSATNSVKKWFAPTSETIPPPDGTPKTAPPPAKTQAEVKMDQGQEHAAAQQNAVKPPPPLGF